MLKLDRTQYFGIGPKILDRRGDKTLGTTHVFGFYDVKIYNKGFSMYSLDDNQTAAGDSCVLSIGSFCLSYLLTLS
jgi:hypothetical protein